MVMCDQSNPEHMKRSLLDKNQIPECVVKLALQLVKRVAWPARRQAMAEVTLALLDGRARVAEAVFGWGRSTVELGLKELQAGIVCRNDLSRRRKPKTEEKHPQLLADIRRILDPKSQAQSHLRTPLAYTNVTAPSVRAALLAGGWLEAALPSVRTLSNVLNRQGYRLRRVEKSQVQKKRLRPMRSSRM
jgi:hypothetical protein